MIRAAFIILAFAFATTSFAGKTVKIKQFSVDIHGVKFWMPATVTVNKGDTVEVEIVSKVPGPNSVHGYMINEFKIKEVATTKPKKVKFKATKAGVFPITCHLHPAHIGGQLVVMED